MAEYREVHTYDHESTNSTAMVIFFVAVLALIAIGLMVWSPWSAPAVRDTTVITQPSAPDAPDTTIVNPPSNNTIITPPAETPKTEINIENKTEGGSTGTTGSNEGESGLNLPK